MLPADNAGTLDGVAKHILAIANLGKKTQSPFCAESGSRIGEPNRGEGSSSAPIPTRVRSLHVNNRQ